MARSFSYSWLKKFAIILVIAAAFSSLASAGSMDWSLSTNGNARTVMVEDGVAYLTEGLDGLTAVDISSQSKLWNVGTAGTAMGADIYNGVVYVAGSGGLTAVDISTQSKLWNINTAESASGVDIAHGVAYVAINDGGLTAVDISSQSKLWNENTGDFAQDVVEYNDVAYVANANSGLTAVELGAGHSVAWSLSTNGYASDITINDGVAYVADGTSGVTAVDISSQSKLWNVGTNDWARGISVNDGVAYVAADDAGLTAVDISSQSKLWNINTNDWARGVDISNNTVYVADDTTGLMAVDLDAELSNIKIERSPNKLTDFYNRSYVIRDNTTSGVAFSYDVSSKVDFRTDLYVKKPYRDIWELAGPSDTFGDIYSAGDQTINKFVDTSDTSAGEDELGTYQFRIDVSPAEEGDLLAETGNYSYVLAYKRNYFERMSPENKVYPGDTQNFTLYHSTNLEGVLKAYVDGNQVLDKWVYPKAGLGDSTDTGVGFYDFQYISEEFGNHSWSAEFIPKHLDGDNDYSIYNSSTWYYENSKGPSVAINLKWPYDNKNFQVGELYYRAEVTSNIPGYMQIFQGGELIRNSTHAGDGTEEVFVAPDNQSVGTRDWYVRFKPSNSTLIDPIKSDTRTVTLTPTGEAIDDIELISPLDKELVNSPTNFTASIIGEAVGDVKFYFNGSNPSGSEFIQEYSSPNIEKNFSFSFLPSNYGYGAGTYDWAVCYEGYNKTICDNSTVTITDKIGDVTLKNPEDGANLGEKSEIDLEGRVYVNYPAESTTYKEEDGTISIDYNSHIYIVLNGKIIQKRGIDTGGFYSVKKTISGENTVIRDGTNTWNIIYSNKNLNETVSAKATFKTDYIGGRPPGYNLIKPVFDAVGLDFEWPQLKLIMGLLIILSAGGVLGAKAGMMPAVVGMTFTALVATELGYMPDYITWIGSILAAGVVAFVGVRLWTGD